MWVVPEDFGEDGKFYYLLAVSIAFYTAHTITVVPYAALGAELSIDTNERTRVFAVRSACHFLGNFSVIPIWWIVHSDQLFSTPRRGFTTITLFLSFMAMGAFIWVVLGTREEAEIQQRAKMSILPAFIQTMRNGPFMLLILIMTLLFIGLNSVAPLAGYINIYYVFNGDNLGAGKVMTVSGYLSTLIVFPGIMLFNWLGVRYGKRAALLFGSAFLAISTLLSWWLYTPEFPWLQVMVLVALVPFAAVIFIFPSAMTADVIDLDELRTGRRREGVYMSVLTFITKLGSSGSTLLTSYCLNWVGFDENLDQQTDDTMVKLRLIFAIVPSIMVVIVTVLLFFYPLSEGKIRRIRAILERRRIERMAGE